MKVRIKHYNQYCMICHNRYVCEESEGYGWRNTKRWSWGQSILQFSNSSDFVRIAQRHTRSITWIGRSLLSAAVPFVFSDIPRLCLKIRKKRWLRYVCYPTSGEFPDFPRRKWKAKMKPLFESELTVILGRSHHNLSLHELQSRGCQLQEIFVTNFRRYRRRR